MPGNRLVTLNLEKLIISNVFIFIHSKARRVDKLLFLIIAGRDGHNANAEHQQWQYGTYTLYMILLTAGMLSFPYQPCSGLWQLKFSDY